MYIKTNKIILIAMALSLSFTSHAELDRPASVESNGEMRADERVSTEPTEERNILDIQNIDVEAMRERVKQRRDDAKFSKKMMMESQWSYFEYIFKDVNNGNIEKMSCRDIGVRAYFLIGFEKRLYRSDIFFNESAYFPMRKQVDEAIHAELSERCPEELAEVRKRERRVNARSRSEDRDGSTASANSIE